MSCANDLVSANFSQVFVSLENGRNYRIAGCSLLDYILYCSPLAGTGCSHLVAGRIADNHHSLVRLADCYSSSVHIDRSHHHIAGSSDPVGKIGLLAGKTLRLDGKPLLAVLVAADCSYSFVASAARDSRPARQGHPPRS